MYQSLCIKIAIRGIIAFTSLIVGCTHRPDFPVSPDTAPDADAGAFSADRLIRIVPTSLDPSRSYAISDIVWHAVILDQRNYALTVSHTLSWSGTVMLVDSNANEHIARHIRFHPSLDLAVIELTEPLTTTNVTSLHPTADIDETMDLHTIVRSGTTLFTEPWTLVEVDEAKNSIVTTLPLAPGMSGWPVLDAKGNLIGLNKARLNTEESESIRLTPDVWKRIEEKTRN